MALGKQVRKYRDLAGWKLETLSFKSGVDVGTINALENRDSTRSKYASQLAKAFGLTLDQLLDEDRDYVLSTGEGEMVLAGSRVEPPNIVTLPPARRIVDTLDELQAVVGQLSPLLQDAGRSVLHKWMDGQVSAAEAAATLEGLLQASAGLLPAAENRAA